MLLCIAIPLFKLDYVFARRHALRASIALEIAMSGPNAVLEF